TEANQATASTTRPTPTTNSTNSGPDNTNEETIDPIPTATINKGPQMAAARDAINRRLAMKVLVCGSRLLNASSRLPSQIIRLLTTGRNVSPRVVLRISQLFFKICVLFSLVVVFVL